VTSKAISSPLVASALAKSGLVPSAAVCSAAKSSAVSERQAALHAATRQVIAALPPTLRRTVEDLFTEPLPEPDGDANPQTKKAYLPHNVSSHFLHPLPIAELGYLFSRFQWKDLMAIRYLLPVEGLPPFCACKGQQAFTPEHAQSCGTGGHVMRRHNGIRDLLVGWFSSLSPFNIVVEPQLHPVHPDDCFPHRSANRDDEARSDILLVEGLFDPNHETYIDACVPNRSSRCYDGLRMQTVLQRHEKRKRAEYAERVQTVEHGDFIPFVVSSSGALGAEAHNLLRLLASRLAAKFDQPYASVLTLMRTELSFKLARASLLCLRGPRKPVSPTCDYFALSAPFAACLARLHNRGL